MIKNNKICYRIFELISAFLNTGIDLAIQQSVLLPNSVGPTHPLCSRNAKFPQLPCSVHCYRSGNGHLQEEESCTSTSLARCINWATLDCMSLLHLGFLYLNLVRQKYPKCFKYQADSLWSPHICQTQIYSTSEIASLIKAVIS